MPDSMLNLKRLLYQGSGGGGFKMIIKIKDIGQSGRELSFDLDIDQLNQRIASAENGGSAHDANPCVFLAPVKTQLRLCLEGSSVLVDGAVAGNYLTTCGRCAEESQQEIRTKISIVLQPKSPGADSKDEAEDVAFGFYENGELSCSGFVEEFLILALPYTVTCSSHCKGLCSVCGQNLNTAMCECIAQEPLDSRFAALKDLKLKH